MAESDDRQGQFYEEPGLYTYSTENEKQKLSFIDIDEDNFTREYIDRGIAEKKNSRKENS